jgi:hypothetical protein
MPRQVAMLTCLFVIAFVLVSTDSHGSTIYPVAIANDKQLQIAIEIDSVKALAGIKLTLSYNIKELSFVNAEKTKMTTSLMHVVNDKIPGKLIIVMAGAKGISGDNVPLVVLTFEVATESPPTIPVNIEQVQLMGEDLREIAVTIRREPLQ